MSRHEVVTIRKPNLSKIDSKTLFERYNHNRKDLERYRQAINYPQYLPWEKARFVAPPAGMTREEAWFLIREIDRSYRQQTPVRTPNGTCLQWLRLDYTDEYLNQFDLHTGAQFMTSQVRMTASEQQTFLTRGIIEESIASSQLEGANVTRKRAKEIIAEKRTPRDKNEWMAINN